MSDKKKLPAFNPNHETAVLNDDLARLAEIIDEVVPGRGKEIAVRISRAFGGSYIYCLQDEKLWRGVRDQWVIEQYDAGHRVPEIARAIKKCERQVWNILGREPGEDKQLKLF